MAKFSLTEQENPKNVYADGKSSHYVRERDRLPNTIKSQCNYNHKLTEKQATTFLYFPIYFKKHKLPLKSKK